MSTHESESGSSRIESVAIANGDVVIYDVERTGAWIQSDDPVEPGTMA